MQETISRTRFECANPILRVADMARSVRYYVETLGFANEEWSGDEFACVTRDGASIYLSLGDQGHPGTWVWVGVSDVEELHREYQARGASIVQPPKSFPWAVEMKVADPDGHILRLGSDPKD
jgi:predicted enzyme related to lactoylglutathione lyase